MKRTVYRQSESSDMGCIIQMVVGLFYMVAGIISTNYLIEVLFNKSIPLAASCAIAFFAAGLTVPAAFIVWILRLSGVL